MAWFKFFLLTWGSISLCLAKIPFFGWKNKHCPQYDTLHCTQLFVALAGGFSSQMSQGIMLSSATDLPYLATMLARVKFFGSLARPPSSNTAMKRHSGHCTTLPVWSPSRARSRGEHSTPPPSVTLDWSMEARQPLQYECIHGNVTGSWNSSKHIGHVNSGSNAVAI